VIFPEGGQSIFSSGDQVRSKVFKFGGEKYIFRGQDFCFYYMFKTISSGHNKIWGQCPPVTTGLGRGTKKVENYWSIGVSSRVYTD